jgi:four helix bundle protein
MNSQRQPIQERSYLFSKSILLFIRPLWKSAEGRVLAHQLLRSATSVGANIMEGQDSSSKRQFLQYLQIALRSSKETQFWLRLLAETKENRDPELSRLREENYEITCIIASIVLRLKQQL